MIHSNTLVASVIATLLFFVTIPIAKRVSARERDPGLFGLLMAAIAAHLIFTEVALWVVNHFYHGVTDYTRYVNQGAMLAHRFDQFNFSLSGTNITVLGDGSVSIAAGVVMAIVGVDKLASFMVFSWFTFLATLAFYRAFSLTFPEANRRRYAYFVFFLPSLLFWNSGISKESMMYLSLGFSAYGAARVFSGVRGGVILLAIGTLIGVYVRPQELLLFLGAFAIAGVFRRSNREKRLRGLRRVLIMGVQALLLVAAVTLAQELGKHAPVFNLTKLSQNNRGQASSIPYHPGPAGYPKDIYTVLFDPLPYNAHGSAQKLAAFENTVILVLIVISLRRFKILLRAAFMKPYVLMSLLYSVAWPYAFAALGNLGLIDRERIMLMPFLLVPLAIPVTPKNSRVRYPWEVGGAVRRRRKKRKQRQARWSATAGAGR